MLLFLELLLSLELQLFLCVPAVAAAGTEAAAVLVGILPELPWPSSRAAAAAVPAEFVAGILPEMPVDVAGWILPESMWPQVAAGHSGCLLPRRP